MILEGYWVKDTFFLSCERSRKNTEVLSWEWESTMGSSFIWIRSLLQCYDIYFLNVQLNKKTQKKISWNVRNVESFAISQKFRPNCRDREAPGKIGKHAIIVNAFIVIVVVFVIILFDDSVYIPILQRFFFHWKSSWRFSVLFLYFKVHIFWEGHKILLNLQYRFACSYIEQI